MNRFAKDFLICLFAISVMTLAAMAQIKTNTTQKPTKTENSTARIKSSSKTFSAQDIIKNYLIVTEWPGPKAFIQSAKNKNIEPCKFIESEEPALSKRKYSVRRIMLISAEAKCPSRAALAKKYLKSKDPVVQEAAIRLTMKLDKPEREKLHKDVLHLRHNSKDAHVLRAVSDYLDVVKK